MAPTPTSPTVRHSNPTVAALAACGLLTLAACAGTTQSAGNSSVTTSVPTIGILATDPPAPTSIADAPTDTSDLPTPPTPPAAVAPPPPPPPPSPTTQPTTTTAPPISEVDPADFFKARHEESGGGINSQNYWWWDTNVPRGQASTAHGPFATAEAAEVRTMLYSSFQPRSSDATVTWDVSWSGYMTSFVGADASAQATITMRVYEIIPGTDTASIGPTVFERVIAEDGVGSALQGVATLRMDGGDTQSAGLPPLDLDKFYRLEAELECSSRVAFSVGSTVCSFGSEPSSGLTVNNWSIRFDNVAP